MSLEYVGEGRGRDMGSSKKNCRAFELVLECSPSGQHHFHASANDLDWWFSDEPWVAYV